MAVAAGRLGFWHGSIQEPPAKTTSVRLFTVAEPATNCLEPGWSKHASEPVISDTHVAETRQFYCACLYFKDIWDTSNASTGGQANLHAAGWLAGCRE
jgi:hypothetical protein